MTLLYSYMSSSHQAYKIKAEKCPSDTCLENYKTQGMVCWLPVRWVDGFSLNHVPEKSWVMFFDVI